jgi:beta-galactosidase
MKNRIKVKICEGWLFRKAGEPGWREVKLPHDWSIEGPFDVTQNKWSGYLPKGIGFYRKTLNIPAEWQGKRICIEFEGIFRNSTLYVNGKEAGYHESGYTGIIYDLSDLLNYGRDNHFEVEVNNPSNGDFGSEGGITHVASFTGNEIDHSGEGWWYEGCGIYRLVWLHVTNPLHVEHWGTFISTPDLSKVNIKISVLNKSGRSQQCQVKVSILDDEQNIVAHGTNVCGTIQNNVSKDVSMAIELDSPQLWSFDSPYLYTAVIEIICNDITVDSHSVNFGVRNIKASPGNGIFLNDQPVRLHGANIHQDFGGLGTALPPRAHEKNVEVLKSMGCNIIRVAHHDAAPALMEACDRLGMLVWAEHRYLVRMEGDVHTLRSLIRRNRNHPSIICWGLANIAGNPNGDRSLTERLKVLNAIAHGEDPTRPTAVGLEANADPNINGFAMVTDIVGYNGGGMGRDDDDHRDYPERIMLISEFSSGRSARGIYENTKLGPETKYLSGDGRWLPTGPQLFSNYHNCEMMEKEWRHIVERPWLCGGIIWAGIDYLGETCGWPVVTSQFGALDICRFPKDSYYFFKQEWTNDQMLYVFPHWTWPDKVGKTVPVWCYTNCEEAELLLNGKSLGRKSRQAQSHIEWLVPYEPGTLTVHGLDAGKIVCSKEIRTAGKAVKLLISADRYEIKTDGEDLSFVTIEILDENDTLVPDADNEVYIEVEGNGKLLGLCNGNPGSHAISGSRSINAFSGKLLTILQSSDKKGALRLTASAENLSSAELTIKVK